MSYVVQAIVLYTAQLTVKIIMKPRSEMTSRFAIFTDASLWRHISVSAYCVRFSSASGRRSAGVTIAPWAIVCWDLAT